MKDDGKRDGVERCGAELAERLIEWRMEWLDLAGRGHGAMVEALKKTFRLEENSVPMVLADFSDQVVTSYIGVSKRWLELARLACQRCGEKEKEG